MNIYTAIQPYPHQREAASFLVSTRNRILGDEPRVGKTGATLLAYEKSGAKTMLVITTASGREVWRKAARDWLGKDAHIVKKTKLKDGELSSSEIIVVSWAGMSKMSDDLAAFSFDVIVADEAHYAKDFRAARTKAFYNTLFRSAKMHVWLLTGTPLANGPLDIFPALQAFRAAGRYGSFFSFRDRFCQMDSVNVGGGRYVDKIVGHKNLDELSAMLSPHMLRRTQSDVGITQPIFETVPVSVELAEMKRLLKKLKEEAGENENAEDTFARVRRVLGSAKAKGVIDIVKDDLEGGLEKVVVMCWHIDTMNEIADGLREAGIGFVKVNGSTSDEARKRAVEDFSKDGSAISVFVGQIVACGEAIDLSASKDLLFAETSYVPKDMRQASLRITNHTQTGQPRVRIATVPDSIDEDIQDVVREKLADISKVLKEEVSA